MERHVKDHSRNEAQDVTTVVNKRTSSEYDVFIGRPSLFGNPFIIGRDGSRKEVVQKYKIYLYERVRSDKEFKREVEKLRGKRLGCFCCPKLCHGDVIVEYLNVPSLF
jgi:hypothetical protein